MLLNKKKHMAPICSDEAYDEKSFMSPNASLDISHRGV